MGSIIDGKIIAETILRQTAERVARLQARGISASFGVVLVGDDKPSHTYVRKKGEMARQLGMEFVLETAAPQATTEEVVRIVHHLQADPSLCGLIVQLPLPDHIDTNIVLNSIRPDIDIDCLTDINLGKLVMNTQKIMPPTAGAVMSILEHLRVDLVGKNVTIVGVGPLVGKPLAIMMMNARASVATVNSKTKAVREKCLAADIIVTGVGKKNLLRGDMVSAGAIVIDTGVSFEAGAMSGDVNVAEVAPIAAYVTPTPGGVGPITIARLLLNTALCAENKYGRSS